MGEGRLVRSVVALVAVAALVAGCSEDDLSTGFADVPGSVGGITGPGAGLTLGPVDELEVDFEGSGSDLGVADTVARGDHVHDADYVLKAGDTMTGALNLPADGLTAGTDQLVLAGGNVGIGTASPTAKLEVQGEVKSVVGGREFYMVPKGGIIMWSGTLATIPAGWALCDGTSGTPDLRNRFILSVSTAENPGASGGSHNRTLTTTNMPSHGHGFTTSTASLNHQHYNDDFVIFYTNTGYILLGGGTTVTRVNSWAFEQRNTNYVNLSHSHTGTTNNTGGGTSFDNRPAYYKLAFIMKL